MVSYISDLKSFSQSIYFNACFQHLSNVVIFMSFWTAAKLIVMYLQLSKREICKAVLLSAYEDNKHFLVQIDESNNYSLFHWLH